MCLMESHHKWSQERLAEVVIKVAGNQWYAHTCTVTWFSNNCRCGFCFTVLGCQLATATFLRLKIHVDGFGKPFLFRQLPRCLLDGSMWSDGNEWSSHQSSSMQRFTVLSVHYFFFLPEREELKTRTRMILSNPTKHGSCLESGL